jgi:DNA invertase Pin-like site-specific DNA recombinase
MSTQESEIIKKILETFVAKADQMSSGLLELRAAIQALTSSQTTVVEKLDNIRLELRELSTRIEMALRK